MEQTQRISMHTERFVKKHNGVPITPGFVRMIHGLPPRIPEKDMGKHRPEAFDDTFDFQLAIDFIESRSKGRLSLRRGAAKILVRLATKMLTTPLVAR